MLTFHEEFENKNDNVLTYEIENEKCSLDTSKKIIATYKRVVPDNIVRWKLPEDANKIISL